MKKYRRFCPGDLADHVENPLHALTFGNDVGKCVLFFEQALEPLNFVVEPAIFKSFFDLQHELSGIKWLGEVAIGSLSHRVDRALHAAKTGENDHRHMGIDRMELMHQRDPIAVSKPQINDAQIEMILANHLYGVVC